MTRPDPRPDQIIAGLSQIVQGKKVAIQYSSGLDSTTLAIQCVRAGAAQVANIVLDPGVTNSPEDAWYNPNQPINYCNNGEQYLRYAKKSQAAFGIDILQMRVASQNSQIVQPQYLRPPDTTTADHAESTYGLTFFSGFVLNLLSASLSVASAQGYDYVFTGHMEWNSHYIDESLAFAGDLSDLFYKYYGNRIKKVARVLMPWRKLGVEKHELVTLNHTLGYMIDDKLHISCGRDVMDENNKTLLTSDDCQYHCDACEHCEQRRDAYLQAGFVDKAYHVNSLHNMKNG